MRALQNLGQDVNHWDTIIIFLLVKKLDPTTIREWEQLQCKDKIKSLSEFKHFLSSRANMLQSIDNNNSTNCNTTYKVDKVFNI